MKFHNIIEDILGNKHRVKILRAMFKYDKEFHIRELARLLDEPLASVARHLNSLSHEKIISVRHAGSVHLIHLNKNHPFFKPLELIFRSEADVFKLLTLDIKTAFSHERDILKVVLFGSLSKGKEKPDSDIDLFILVKNNANMSHITNVVDKLSFSVQNKYGNALSPMIRKEKEFKTLKNKAIYKAIKSGVTMIDKGGEW